MRHASSPLKSINTEVRYISLPMSFVLKEHIHFTLNFKSDAPQIIYHKIANVDCAGHVDFDSR